MALRQTAAISITAALTIKKSLWSFHMDGNRQNKSQIQYQLCRSTMDFRSVHLPRKAY